MAEETDFQKKVREAMEGKGRKSVWQKLSDTVSENVSAAKKLLDGSDDEEKKKKKEGS